MEVKKIIESRLSKEQKKKLITEVQSNTEYLKKSNKDLKKRVLLLNNLLTK